MFVPSLHSSAALMSHEAAEALEKEEGFMTGPVRKIINRIRRVDISKSANDEWLALSLSYLTVQQKGVVSEGDREKVLARIDAFRLAVRSAPGHEVEEPEENRE
jgi:hypothetical protein